MNFNDMEKKSETRDVVAQIESVAKLCAWQDELVRFHKLTGIDKSIVDKLISPLAEVERQFLYEVLETGDFEAVRQKYYSKWLVDHLSPSGRAQPEIFYDLNFVNDIGEVYNAFLPEIEKVVATYRLIGK